MSHLEISRQCTPSKATVDMTEGCIFVTVVAGGVAKTADGAAAHGILTNAPDVDEAAAFDTVGAIHPVRASEVIPEGSTIASAANGEAKVATAGDEKLGVAYCEGAAAVGDLVPVLFIPSGAQV